MKAEFFGQSLRDADNTGVNPSRLLNCYRETVQGRSAKVLKSVLGAKGFTSLDGVFLRAMERVGDYIYAAQGGKLWRISQDGGKRVLGSIENSAETTISSNNGIVTVAAGGNYYTWDGATLESPDTGAIENIGSVTFIGQRTVLTEKGGRRFVWSDPADPKTIDGLSFATAEARDGDLLRCIALGGALWLIKADSMERWYDAGTEFLPLDGSVIEYGLKDYGLIAKMPNAAFMVANNDKAYILSGSEVSPISSGSVNTSIKFDDPKRVFYYRDEGHDICCIQFGSRPAWCFVVGEGEWHERTEGDGEGPWPVVACAEAFGGFYAGTETGAIWTLERTNRDATAPLIRRAVSRTFQSEGDWFSVSKFQVQGRPGWSVLGRETSVVLGLGDGTLLDVGSKTALGIKEIDQAPRPAQIMLRTSRDHGQTWGGTITRSFGDIGDFGHRVIWRGLGRFRQVNFEITMSDPTDIPIDAEAFFDLS